MFPKKFNLVKLIKVLFTSVLFLFLFSCGVLGNAVLVPVPDENYFEPEKPFETGSVVETMNGSSMVDAPGWLKAFIYGGNREIEKIYSYREKYVFVGSNEGTNLAALRRWADGYAPPKDLAVLAAARIEKRMISTAALYPDNEYGSFFEVMVKNAYSAEYTDAVKEDIYWIKTEVNQENDNGGPVPAEGAVSINGSSGIYIFFILITIDKITMQTIISNMIEESISGITVTGAQRNAIVSLQQDFFEGF
ncbi:MAG: hypothetical protein LBQ89_03100 [Treponema sp.]|nr:hypothetical protein [Treponema sp.]